MKPPSSHNNYYARGSLLSEDRDLRPATFIRDIETRTLQLEEEKLDYHLKKKSAVDSQK
jgi:hypothetical protein